MTDTFDKHVFGRRIKSIRKALRMTQEKFGQSVGKTYGIVSEVEQGKTRASLELITNILEIHNVNPFYFMLGRGEMFQKPPQKPAMGLHSIGSPIKNMDQLMWYLEHSALVSSSVFGYAVTLIHANLDYIADEIEAALNEEE
ncbi:MAG: helix-turn-helix transcriptional regulator [bacterium]|nr:helix-turn-helix transcriptional regulator [bacterium]